MLDRPDLALAPYRAHLGDLARDLAGAGDAGIEERVLALRAVMVDRHGYRGDDETYDALDNADLARVIDRRRGLPVALSILWLHAARSRGWSVTGLNVPGHFMIRLDAEDGAAIVDPFNRGHTPTAAELHKLLSRAAEGGRAPALEDCPPIGNRATLLRLQNNIKLRLLQAEQPARAVAVIERMLMIAPHEGVLWLHRRFETSRMVLNGGPTSALLWIFQEWLAIVFSFGSRRLHTLLYVAAMLLTFPFKFLDVLVKRQPLARHASSCFIYIGRKPLDASDGARDER